LDRRRNEDILEELEADPVEKKWAQYKQIMWAAPWLEAETGHLLDWLHGQKKTTKEY
jgi:NTP pyrophosphatase (non-canonical NTP hydrolase)